MARAAIDVLETRGQQVRFSVSYTTRAPRPGEVDGEHYHFVDSTQFEQMAGNDQFLEHANVYDRRYGTGRAETMDGLSRGQDIVMDIDWQGARQVKQAWPEVVTIFILPPSLNALRQRLEGRGQDDDSVIDARMQRAADEISHYNEYDYLIINDDFKLAVGSLASIFQGERQRRSRSPKFWDEALQKVMGEQA